MADDRDRFRRALDFMNGTLGIQHRVVAPLLKRLLKVYSNEWNYIEEENYRVLADSYFDRQETQLHKKKDIAKPHQQIVTRNIARNSVLSHEANSIEEKENGSFPRSVQVSAASSSGLQLETISYREILPEEGYTETRRTKTLEMNEKDLEVPAQVCFEKLNMDVSEPPASTQLKGHSSKHDGQEQITDLLHTNAPGLSRGCQHCQHCQSSSFVENNTSSGAVGSHWAEKECMMPQNACSIPPIALDSVHQECMASQNACLVPRPLNTTSQDGLDSQGGPDHTLPRSNCNLTTDITKTALGKPEDQEVATMQSISSSTKFQSPMQMEGKQMFSCPLPNSSHNSQEENTAPILCSEKEKSEAEFNTNLMTVAQCAQQNMESDSLRAIAETYSGASDESLGRITNRESASTDHSIPVQDNAKGKRLISSTHCQQSHLKKPKLESQICSETNVKKEYPEPGVSSDSSVRRLAQKSLALVVKQEPEIAWTNGSLSMQQIQDEQLARGSLNNHNHLHITWNERERRQYDVNDISRGEEKVPISVDAESPSEKLPENFYYISKSIAYQNAYVNFSLARIGDDSCCINCYDDCLKAAYPCACARETGGVYAYTSEGRIRESFLNEVLEDKRNHDSSKRLYFCESGYTCPVERTKNELNPAPCKGHPMRKFVKECWSKCGCSRHCSNRLVQRGISYKLQVFLTREGKGWGVRTLEALPQGVFVCEYVGEILTNIELDTRNRTTNEEGAHYPVLLDADWSSENVLKDEEALCLDATQYGNVARFLNHRCYDANVVDIPVEIESPDHHYYHIAFFTVRPVEAWEELTWDYSIDFEDNDHPIKAFQCLCGSKFCRGQAKTL